MIRKICKVLIVLMCILTLILPHASVVIAATLTNDIPNEVNEIKLTVSEYREGGKESTGYISEKYDVTEYKYIVDDLAANEGGTTVLKIVDCDETNQTTYDNAFYCLDGRAEFPSKKLINYRRVTKNFLSEKPDTLASLSDENYNSICWLINNIYLSKQMTQTERAKQKDELLNTAFKEIIEDRSSEPYIELNDIKNVITDDDIDFVQQWAIWYFTNYSQSTFQGVPFTNESKDLPTIDLNNGTIQDSMGKTRREWLNILYKYFVNNAIANKDKDYSSPKEEYPSIVEKNQKCSVEGSNYKVGPFKVSKPSSEELSYTLKLTDGTNEISSDSYEIKSVDGQIIDKSIDKLFDTEYYIYFPVSGNTIQRVSLNLSYTKYETKASVWKSTEETTSYEYQPVLLVTKESVNVNDSASAEINAVFDLALQKYITKLNSVEITDRNPKITYEDGEITYSHTEDPLTVKVGDFVEYTITVYNEGEISGYASEICDDIPEGLIFDANNEINKKYNWKMYDSDGNETADSTLAKKIKTNYLAKSEVTDGVEDNLIKPFSIDSFSQEQPVIDCKSIKVVFEVGKISNDKEIINTAEITDDTDSSGNAIEDKDSVPGNDIKIEDDIDNEKILVKIFDLSLKKFITKVNGKAISESREPVVDVSPLNAGKTDATYTTIKTPVKVSIGDKVTYKIRVYNEGSIDAYASSISDYIPEGLGYIVNYKENINNLWSVPESEISTTTLGEITNGTKNLSLDDFSDSVSDLEKVSVVKGKVKVTSSALDVFEGTDHTIKAFDGNKLSYRDVEITCVVLSDIGLKNIAEIADAITYNDSTNLTDRDSTPDTVDPNDYPGDDQDQDDNDVEYLTVDDFDLSLKKFITSVNSTEVKDREPKMEYKDGKFTYSAQNENPVEVAIGDKVEYTIRVYNEGNISGYAKEIMDDIPEGLIYDTTNETNTKYGWKMYDADGNETTDTAKAKKIKTDYLSKEKSAERSEDAIINAFNTSNPTEISYKDIKVVFTVSPETQIQIITNTAEITNDSDSDGNEIDDKDSEPNNGDEKEDDIDKEQIKVARNFDLALQKFITEVNNKAVDGRTPKISYNDGKFTYTHPTTPLEVNSGDTVVYTINVYNEGELDGYAQSISDDIPAGLVFDSTNSINKTYGWVMYDEDGNETTDGTKATLIKTDYLSKEKSQARGKDEIIEAFDSEKGNISYGSVKVAFVVSTTSNKDDTIINTAEIVEDADKDGNKIDDIDSTPNNKKDGEDDIDKERVHVGYFDLSLKKQLAKSIVTENDQVTETTAKNGKLMKIEINRKNINSTIVKLVYSISITNEGTISGYATGIKDYIPDGLEFVSSDNDSTWKSTTDGVIECSALENTLINPGETKTVQVVLRWKNSDSNLGVKKNIAEISSDKNDSNDVDDIDSTPNNKKDGEDDIDYAEVILSISTGRAETYVLLIIIVSSITAGGVLLVKKFVM